MKSWCKEARAFFWLCCILGIVALGQSAVRAADGEKRLTIIASLFPQYDFALRIVGDTADVRLLLPPGVESHAYEPTPSDMKAIAEADVFIYTGPEMEPWAATLARTAEAGRIVDASARITLKATGDGDPADHDHDHSDHDSHYHAYDPHIWLDPIHAITMVDTITEALAEVNPAAHDLYMNNGEYLVKQIDQLHQDFKNVVARSPRRALVFGDRFAFAYFFSRYGLEEVGPYAFCAPGAEPGVKAVIDSVKYIRDNAVQCIYHELHSTGRLAQVIADETGVALLAVDSMHNPTADQRAAGYSYVEGLRNAMQAFARGLE